MMTTIIGSSGSGHNWLLTPSQQLFFSFFSFFFEGNSSNGSNSSRRIVRHTVISLRHSTSSFCCSCLGFCAAFVDVLPLCSLKNGSVVNADVGKLSCNRQTADVSRYTLRAGETREYFIPVPINVARLIPSRTQGQSVATDHRCKAAVNQYGG